VLWSQIMAAPDGKLHRAWVENLNGRATFFHQYSLDNGRAGASRAAKRGANERGDKSGGG